MAQPAGDAADRGGALGEQAVEIERASLALVEVTLAALASATDLSVLQARVLLAVERHKPQTLSELGRLMDMSPPATSRIVTRLVSAGLLERGGAGHDRREVTVALTPRGRRALKRLSEARAAAIGGPLSGMSAADRAALRAGLAAFAEEMDSHLRDREGREPGSDAAG